MMLWLWIPLVMAGPVCPVLRVAPPGQRVGIQMGAKWLPRASLVRVEEAGSCTSGLQRVRVLSIDGWHRMAGKELAAVGQAGCVAGSALKTVEEMLLIDDRPGRSAGQMRGPLKRGGLCGEPALVDEHGVPIPDEALAGLRPIGSDQVETLRPIKAEWTTRFGALDWSHFAITDWGKVALPMSHELTEEERAQEWEREQLDTDKRREKATDAVGAMVDGVAVYQHFLGADAPRSDRWGTPDTVVALLGLLDRWGAHCRGPGAPAHARPQTCTVQVGDLGWYNGKRPDPLGHQDHHAGTCVDLRLFRSDGSRYEALWNQSDDRPGRGVGYSRFLTEAFLKTAVATEGVSVVHFNDQAVLSLVDGVTASPGHDDHIHLCFGP
jgi:hypothetical protein